jgi:hypothetical protein
MSKMLENSSAKYEEGHHMAWITPCLEEISLQTLHVDITKAESELRLRG